MTKVDLLAVALTCSCVGMAFGQSAEPTQPPTQLPAPTTATTPNGTEVTVPIPTLDAGAGPAPAPRIWGSADYLLGWIRGDALPPLVTTSPAGTAQSAAGVLGQPGTKTLFGGSSVNGDARSGARADLGVALDDAGTISFEAGFFILGTSDAAFGAAATGTPIIARPFTDVTTGLPSSALVAYPGVASGRVEADDSSRNLYSANFDLRQTWFNSSWCRIDALAGYRFLVYDDRLSVDQSVVPTSGPFAPGTTVASQDSFTTRNIFNGVDLGFCTEFHNGPWSLEILTKAAIGDLKKNVTIAGSQEAIVPGGAPVTSQGGLLALSSNIGANEHPTWDILPEIGAILSWDVTDHIRFRAGYTIIWLPLVARAGDEVDLNINPGLIPPATTTATGSTARPAFTGGTSVLWTQNLSFGMEVRF